MSEETSTPRIPAIRKFDGKNYRVWREQMKSYLTAKDAWGVLSEAAPLRPTTLGESKTRSKTIAADDAERQYFDWVERNKIARTALLLSLDDNRAIQIIGLATAREIMLRLDATYGQTSSVNKVLLQKQFFDAKQGETERVINYANRVIQTADEIRQCGEMLTEAAITTKIVTGLNDKFTIVMSNWMSNSKWQEQSITNLLPHLTAHEQLMQVTQPRKRNETNLSEQVRNKPHPTKLSNKQQNSQQTGQTQRPQQNHQQANSQPIEVDKNTCLYCNKKGHWKRDCRKFKYDKQQSQQHNTEVDQPELIVAEVGLAANEEPEEWILDSGATQHMSPDKNVFETYREIPPKSVRFGNRQYGSGIGVGTVNLRTKVGDELKTIMLCNVLHVPDLSRKLISLSAATTNGAVGSISNDSITLTKNGKILLIAEKSGNLYKVNANNVMSNNADTVEEQNEASETSDRSSSTSSTSSDNEPDSNDDASAYDNRELDLWHKRFCHVNHRYIKEMAKHNACLGLTLSKQSKRKTPAKTIQCTTCKINKKTMKNKISRTTPKATNVGQRLHSDISGIMDCSSLSGAKYFVLFKDECTNYRLIRFIKDKAAAYESVKEVIAQIRSDTGETIRCLVSDRGSEYTSNKMSKWLIDNLIGQDMSAPTTPSQNGFIEREMRTTIEAARTILKNYSLPHELWEEAMRTTIYVLNRTINSKNHYQTPFELYFGTKPSVKHIRVFGSLALTKVQPKKRSGYQKKLEDRASMGVLVGYEQDFNYRIYDPDTNKVFITREVEFDETKTMKIELNKTTLHNENDTSTEEENNLTQEHNNVFEDPNTYEQAIKSQNSAEWSKAMDDEMDSLKHNNTWDLIERPVNRHIVSSKWVYRRKIDTRGGIQYKARLVARGFTQKHGVDYMETYSPVVKIETIRILFAIAAHHHKTLIHFDIKTAYLNGILDEEIFMEPPQGYAHHGKVCKLNRSLYGLKQAGRVWHETFTAFLQEQALRRLKSDSCVFVRDSPNVILAIYVDDGLLCADNSTVANDLIHELAKRFGVKTMALEKFVGLEVQLRDGKILVNQSNYISKLAHQFEIADMKYVPTPLLANTHYNTGGVVGNSESKCVDVPYKQIIGALLYVATKTRPDVAYAVSMLARFADAPKLAHWQAAKRVLSYLHKTNQYALNYNQDEKEHVIAFSDADFAACTDTRRSVTGLIVLLFGTPIIWQATKQKTVAESTTEAELVAANAASRELMWLINLLNELKVNVNKPTLYIDNQSTLKLIQNNQNHSRIKHIDIKLLALRERLLNIEVKYIETQDNTADLLTKALPRERHEQHRSTLLQ